MIKKRDRWELRCVYPAHSLQQLLVSHLSEAMASGCACSLLSKSELQLFTDSTINYYENELVTMNAIFLFDNETVYCLI